jgi:hypothetical protein
MNEHSHTKKSWKAALRIRKEFIYGVLVVAVLAGGFAFSNHSSSPFVSAEVRFTDASRQGLLIVPASCPSNPYDADSPYGCSGGSASSPLCPDGSVAPSGNVALCGTACPSGTTLIDGSCVSNPSCPAGTTLVNGSCLSSGPPGGGGGGGGSSTCQTGYVSNGSGCVFSGCPTGYTLQGSQCVFTGCPAGYSQSGSQCIFSGCLTGYTLEGSQCVFVGCSSSYICLGSNLYYQNASCQQSLAQVCSYGCATNACTPPPAAIISLTAAPTIVKQGETSQISWNTQNVVVGSCAVSGTNNDSWSGASGTETSSAIEGQVIYTLSCTGLDDSNATQQVTVNVVPSFQEQ